LLNSVSGLCFQGCKLIRAREPNCLFSLFLYFSLFEAAAIELAEAREQRAATPPHCRARLSAREGVITMDPAVGMELLTGLRAVSVLQA
jgi:hypothetical protein